MFKWFWPNSTRPDFSIDFNKGKLSFFELLHTSNFTRSGAYIDIALEYIFQSLKNVI